MQFHNFPRMIRDMKFFKLVFFVTILLAGILFIFIDPRRLDASDFMLIAWTPAQELLRTGAVNADYPYPLWTLITLLPFTVWPFGISQLLWFIFNLFTLAASLVVLIRVFEWNTSPVFFLSILFLGGYFLPILTSLWLGQLTIFLLLILVLTAYTFKHQQWTWLGIVLGLSFLKPQLMILLVGFLLLWSLWNRRWQVLTSFGLTMIFLVLISLPFISSPSQLIGGGIGYHLVTYLQKTSTIWGLLLVIGFPFWVPLIISLFLLGWLGYIWLLAPPRLDISPNRSNFLFSVTIIINLMIVPYSWMHNLTLLLLPFGYVLTLVLRMKSGARFFWSLLLFSIMHPLMLGVFFLFSIPDESQAYQIIPAIVLLPVIYYLELQSASQNNRSGSEKV